MGNLDRLYSISISLLGVKIKNTAFRLALFSSVQLASPSVQLYSSYILYIISLLKELIYRILLLYFFIYYFFTSLLKKPAFMCTLDVVYRLTGVSNVPSLEIYSLLMLHTLLIDTPVASAVCSMI